jgi:hypothetical protein
MAQGPCEGGGVKKPKLKSKRERAAAEARRLFESDPIFRQNIIDVVAGAMGPLNPFLEAVLTFRVDQLPVSPIPPSVLPGNEPPKE